MINTARPVNDLQTSTFNRFAHQGRSLDEKKARKHGDYWIYSRCEKCGVSLYNWTQGGMYECKGAQYHGKEAEANKDSRQSHSR